MCHLHHVGQGGARGGVRHPEHGGGARTDAGVDLPGLGVTLARSGKAVREPDLDDSGASRADGVVVGVALAAHHHDLVGNAAGPRQRRHHRGIEPGDAGRSREQQAGGRSRGDKPALRPRDGCDPSCRAGMQRHHVHTRTRRLDHCRSDLRVHDAPGKPRRRALAVDDHRHAEPSVDAIRQTFFPKLQLGARVREGTALVEQRMRAEGAAIGAIQQREAGTARPAGRST